MMKQAPDSTVSQASQRSTSGVPWWRLAALAALCLAVLVICQVTRPANEATESGVIMKLPIFVNSFIGLDQDPSLAETTILPKDTEFKKKVYSNLARQNVTCQIVLSGGEKRSIHRPEICLPGQGWTITDARPVAIRLKTGALQHVTKLTLTREVQISETQRQKVTAEFMYWFVGKDKTTADHLERVLLTSWDRVMHNVNHRWAYVIVMAVVPPAMDASGPSQQALSADTLKVLEEFIGKIAPEVQKPGVIPS